MSIFDCNIRSIFKKNLSGLKILRQYRLVKRCESCTSNHINISAHFNQQFKDVYVS